MKLGEGSLGLFGLASVALMVGTSADASNAFVQPTSWERGVGGATYQHWNVFNDDTDTGTDSIIVDTTPDVAGFVNPNSGTPSVTETSGNGFLTGGGNIYSFSGATTFEVEIPEALVGPNFGPTVPEHNLTAIVQIKTLGTELDYSSILLNGQSAVDTAELYRLSLGEGQFGGADVETWLLFNISYASLAMTDALPLTLTFNASDSSMSLDELSIDTALSPFGYYSEPNPVPEPGMAALACLGAFVLTGGRRFRTTRR